MPECSRKFGEDIIAGKYAEHDELREITIGKELGVSRTPVQGGLKTAGTGRAGDDYSE